jgi:hypothetical protein
MQVEIYDQNRKKPETSFGSKILSFIKAKRNSIIGSTCNYITYCFIKGKKWRRDQAYK